MMHWSRKHLPLEVIVSAPRATQWLSRAIKAAPPWLRLSLTTRLRRPSIKAARGGELDQSTETRQGTGWRGRFTVEAHSKDDGLTRTLCLVSVLDWEEATAACLACQAVQLLDETVPRGVHLPDEVLDFSRCIKDLERVAPHCLELSGALVVENDGAVSTAQVSSLRPGTAPPSLRASVQ